MTRDNSFTQLHAQTIAAAFMDNWVASLEHIDMEEECCLQSVAKICAREKGEHRHRERHGNIYYGLTQQNPATPTSAHRPPRKTKGIYASGHRQSYTRICQRRQSQTIATTYTGPHEIVRKENDRNYVIKINGRDIVTSTERIKSAYLPDEDNREVQSENTEDTSTNSISSANRIKSVKFAPTS